MTSVQTPDPTARPKDPAEGSPYALDPKLLTPTAKAQDMIAHYLGDLNNGHREPLVGDPMAVAFAAIYVIEAGGLAIVERKDGVRGS